MGESELRKNKNERKMAAKQGKKPKASRGKNQSGSLPPVEGVVVARKCKYCQHHEIGVKTKKGYLPLKPGMKIEVMEE